MADASIEQWADQRAQVILNEGGKFAGVSSCIDPDVPPEWFEPQRFKRAQDVWSIFKVVIRSSQLYGLNLVLCHEEGVVPLLVTGNSSTVPKLFYRYLSTGLHVNNWFEGGSPFQPDSACHASVVTVRSMHHQVAQKMNAEPLIVKPPNTTVWISQRSMAMAQFSFMGLMAAFPELGFTAFTQQDMDAVFHFWRVIGYCLGLEDRYNLCEGSVLKIQALCRIIYARHWLPAIERNYELGMNMSKDITTAMSQVDHNLDFNAFMRYGAPFLGLREENYPLVGFQQKVKFYLLSIALGYLSRSRFICWLLGRMSDRMFQRAASQRVQIFQSLKEKYPEVRYPNEKCPYDIKFDYKIIFDHHKTRNAEDHVDDKIDQTLECKKQ